MTPYVSIGMLGLMLCGCGAGRVNSRDGNEYDQLIHAHRHSEFIELLAILSVHDKNIMVLHHISDGVDTVLPVDIQGQYRVIKYYSDMDSTDSILVIETASRDVYVDYASPTLTQGLKYQITIVGESQLHHIASQLGTDNDPNDAFIDSVDSKNIRVGAGMWVNGGQATAALSNFQQEAVIYPVIRRGSGQTCGYYITKAND
jgi:hypothetical protein